MAFIGACLPDSCTRAELKTVVSQLLKNTKEVLLYDIVDDFSDHYSYGWTFYLTVALLLLFISSTIYSSWLNVKSKDNWFLGSFNGRENMKIFTYRKNELNVWNGIRSISMFWVIIGHVYLQGFQGAENLMHI